MLHERLRLFAAAAENKRVAPFEPQDALACPRQIDEAKRNVALDGGRFAAAFAGIDLFGPRRPFKDALIYKRVVDHHLGLPQRIEGVQGQ